MIDIPYEPKDTSPLRKKYKPCTGLRSKEGRFLEIDDLLLDRRLLHIRRAKTQMERYVPFMKSQRDDFFLYLKECRPQLVREHSTGWLLLNNQGRQASAEFLLTRLKSLLSEAGIQKRIGLHSLRHTIATHLLQSGMRIEDIAVFLGHKNIDSTQRYTHIVQESE